MKCPVIIWRSWVRTLVGSNFGFVVTDGLELESQCREIRCHDLKFMGSNPGQVELWVLSMCFCLKPFQVLSLNIPGTNPSSVVVLEPKILYVSSNAIPLLRHYLLSCLKEFRYPVPQMKEN